MGWRAVFDIIDGWVDRFNEWGVGVVQNCIADPLQFSGIDLDTQIRVCSFGITGGWMLAAVDSAMHRTWVSLALNGLLVALSLNQALMPVDVLRFMVSKYEGIIWTYNMLWVLPGVLARSLYFYALLLISGAYLLRFFLKQCEPKPPAPQMHLQESL